MLSTLMGLTIFSLFSFFSESFSNLILAKVRPVSAKLTLHWGIEEVKYWEAFWCLPYYCLNKAVSERNITAVDLEKDSQINCRFI